MTVRVVEGGTIQLLGDCASEDAAALLDYLTANSEAKVDWRECVAAHTAVIQVLWVARRELRGPPADDFLAHWIEPCLV
jgi:hypothetical protein